MQHSNSVPESFQILALDGGGVKAIYTAHLLARLEADLGLRLTDHFDLVAGTSAGGIIALALGAGIPPAEIVDHYQSLASTVFPPSRRGWYRWPARLHRATYKQEPLRAALEEILGERLLGDSFKRLLVPSWDALVGSVHIFKTPHHPRPTRDHRIRMVDVALATSAAPTFLPAASVDGHRLLDGGLWANNPSALAVAEAVSMLNVPLERIKVLNIGTTTPLTDHPRALDRAGYLRWATRAVDLSLIAASRGAQGLTAHLVGADQYQRFDAVVPRGRYRLDRSDAGDLAGFAAASSRGLSPTFVSNFTDHFAAPYEPCISRSEIQV
jgi:patatin-like phospholipase/acyl hydrolase